MTDIPDKQGLVTDKDLYIAKKLVFEWRQQQESPGMFPFLHKMIASALAQERKAVLELLEIKALVEVAKESLKIFESNFPLEYSQFIRPKLKDAVDDFKNLKERKK